MKHTQYIIAAIAMLAAGLMLSTPAQAVTMSKYEMEVYTSSDYSLQVAAPHHNMTLGLRQKYQLCITSFGYDVITMEINGAFIRSISSQALILDTVRPSETGWLNITFSNATQVKLTLSWPVKDGVVVIPNDSEWENWWNNTYRDRYKNEVAVNNVLIPIVTLPQMLGGMLFAIIVMGVIVFKRKNTAIKATIAQTTNETILSPTGEKITGVPQETHTALVRER